MRALVCLVLSLPFFWSLGVQVGHRVDLTHTHTVVVHAGSTQVDHTHTPATPPKQVRHKPFTLLLLDTPPPKPQEQRHPAPPSACPPSEWVQELGRLLSSQRYAGKLAAVLVLHASWGMKVHLWGLGFKCVTVVMLFPLCVCVGHTPGWMDGWMGGGMDGWMDGWMDG